MATLSFTLPLRFRFRLFLPFALTFSFAWPATTDLLVTASPADDALTPFPLPTSSPALGTVTVIVAVPLFLFRLTPAIVKRLLGLTASSRTRYQSSCSERSVPQSSGWPQKSQAR